MIREVFSIGSFSISPFGLMLVAALIGAYWQLRPGMEKLGAGDDEDANSIVFGCGLLGILGGKIYYAILFGDWHLLFGRAGIVWYGCVIGGFLTLVWIIRRRQLPFWRTLDATGPALALGYAIGRLGCFLVGDDYGLPTTLPWGVEFREGLPETTPANLEYHFGIDVPPELAGREYVPVHPTQIYSSLVSAVIWLFARRRLDRPPKPGLLFLGVLGLLAVERFIVEFIRAKDDRFFFDGSLTLAQLISVGLLAVVLVVAWQRRRSGASAA